MLFLLNIQHASKVAHRTYPIRNLVDHATVAVAYGQQRKISRGNTNSEKDKVVQNICKTTKSDDIVKKMLERYAEFNQERSFNKIDDQGIDVTNENNDVMTFSTTSSGLLDPKLLPESLKAAARNRSNRNKVSKTASEPTLIDRESKQTTTPEFDVNPSMSSDRTSKGYSKYVPHLKPRINDHTFQETSIGLKPELISEVGLREKPMTIHKAKLSGNLKAADSLSVYKNPLKSDIISQSSLKSSPPTAADGKSNNFESKRSSTLTSKKSRVKCPCKKKTSALKCDSNSASQTSIGLKPELISEIGLREKPRTIHKARLSSNLKAADSLSVNENSSKSGIMSESSLKCLPPTSADGKLNSFESKGRSTLASRVKSPCKKKTSASKWDSNSASKTISKESNATSIPDLNFWKKPAKPQSEAKCGLTVSTDPSTLLSDSIISEPGNASKSESQMKCKQPADNDIKKSCKKSADGYKSNGCKKAAKVKCGSKDLSKPPDGNENRRCLNYMCPDSTWNKISDEGYDDK